MLTFRFAALRPSYLSHFASVLGAAAIFAGQSQAGVIIDYPNFSSTAGLTLVGSTTTTSSQLELTPAAIGQSGAAYSTTAVPLGAGDTFSTTFQFQITDTGGIDPADGITFVLAASPSGLGTGGGDIGYGGVGNSVAIEFDTYDNGSDDGDSSNHVAIDEDGSIDDGTSGGDQDLVNAYGVSSCGFPSSYLASGCMANGDIWSVTIGYDGTNLAVSVWDMSGTHAEAAPFTIYTAQPVNISSFLGTTNAYVGFTGGTGSGFEQQDILNWELANTSTLPPPSTTPEPATMTLVFAGIAGIVLAKRRRS
jgi:hypothetical protein